MFDLNEKEVLYRTRVYTLARPPGNIVSIHVCERFEGNPRHNYIAFPYSFWPAKQKFWGFGNNETDALKDCLNKIKSVSTAEMYDLPTRRSSQEVT